jgi:hypothetical protein
MHWFVIVSAVAFAGQVAAGADAGQERPDTSSGVLTLPSAGGRSEAVPGVVITLPGPPAPIAAPVPAPPKAVESVVPRVPPAVADHPPVPHPPAPLYPPEFERDSALFCQTRVGQWKEADARALLGEPTRQRLALGEDKSEAGLIFAFADPTGRYKELELDFASQTGALRGVFAYPRKMTWQECRRLWGTNVTARKANQGRTFYSYLNRRLDVLVDPTGKVISLGLY